MNFYNNTPVPLASLAERQANYQEVLCEMCPKELVKEHRTMIGLQGTNPKAFDWKLKMVEDFIEAHLHVSASV